jgi:hypothetical protein
MCQSPIRRILRQEQELSRISPFDRCGDALPLSHRLPFGQGHFGFTQFADNLLHCVSLTTHATLPSQP